MRWFSLIVVLAGCPAKAPPTPAVPPAPSAPDAPTRDHVHDEHGVERSDPYYWMRDREDAEVIAYIEAENAWTEHVTAGQEALRKTVYDEIVGRIQEDDTSVPTRSEGDWWTWSRTVAGLDYPIFLRMQSDTRPVPPAEGPLDGEQVMLDMNALAEGHEYLSVGGWAVTRDHATLAYAVDTTGREVYDVAFSDLATGELLADTIVDVTGDMVWANDGKTLFYTVLDEALRPYEVRKHVLGDQDADEVVYTEADEKFRVWVSRFRSGEALELGVGSSMTNEIRILDADDPDGEWHMVSPRHAGHEYSVEHAGDRLLLLTNDCDDDEGKHGDCAVNFKLMEADLDASDRADWREVVAHRDDATLLGAEAFAGHVVLTERVDGLLRVRVMPDDGDEWIVPVPEAAYWIGTGGNRIWETDVLRYYYESPVTPSSVFEIDLASQETELLKQDPVPGYEAANYTVERQWADAPDGTKVPVTLVMRADLGEGPHPLWLTGYGAYGASMDPWFGTSRISLLDRGVVYAIAHVRGGADLGRRWYEDGKFLAKKNSFTDFVAVAQHLVDDGVTAPEKLAIEGGSAGGLLMGAVVNLQPDLFRVCVAEVPFVDVVTTMLDESIPLTANEWEEWGDPRDKEYFDYMLSYSPYDNVEAKAYPAMLITSGLNDPRVQYWEPTKWTAKLRDLNTSERPLLLKTNMGAGHGGASGRYGRIEERSFSYAFVLAELGLGAASGDQPGGM